MFGPKPLRQPRRRARAGEQPFGRSEVVTALPFFTRENPIIITPWYELHFLDRPKGFDLPPRLNDLVMDFHIFRVYDNAWIFDFALTPGLYADDHSLDSSDACRLNGRAVGVYAPSPEWKWLLGVTYLNGAWAKVVPVVGFDRAGTRLGYGKGHYDRTIAALRARGRRPPLIGIAFSVQEVDTIPHEPHDVRLDLIVTENGILDPLA